MDIGPVRRRLTVEPVVSPVAAEPAPRHEPAASERAERPAAERPVAEREAAEHGVPEPGSAPAARA